MNAMFHQKCRNRPEALRYLSGGKQQVTSSGHVTCNVDTSARTAADGLTTTTQPHPADIGCKTRNMLQVMKTVMKTWPWKWVSTCYRAWRASARTAVWPEPRRRPLRSCRWAAALWSDSCPDSSPPPANTHSQSDEEELIPCWELCFLHMWGNKISPKM